MVPDEANQMRATRIAEIMEEFRSLQHNIAQIKVVPKEDETSGEGYRLLQECANEGRAVLKAPFSADSDPPGGDVEEEARQLQQVMLDAFSRRFLAQKIYLRCTAAMRWINGRNAILEDCDETPLHTPALSIVTSALRTELASITNIKVDSDLRASDRQRDRWVEEDPPMQAILQFIAEQRSRSSSPLVKHDDTSQNTVH